MTVPQTEMPKAQTPPEQACDVIIIGGGMVGMTLALALASGGLRPALVDLQPQDAQTSKDFDGRASAIAYSSFRFWQVLGLAEDLKPHAQRIEQILVTDGRAPGAAAAAAGPAFLRFESEEIADRSDGEPLGYMLENRQIRTALIAAIARAGIAVYAPAMAKTLDISPRGAVVGLADGQRLSAPLIVGAEGRQSFVRQQAKIGLVGWNYDQLGLVATVAMQKPHLGIAHEYFLPSGPFAILPLTDNRASLVWTERTDRGQALANARPEVFEAHLRRRFGEFLGDITVLGPRFSYPLALQLAETMVKPRLALLGDAAHGVHPIAGQGLNLGLKDAAALAQVLVDAHRLGEDMGSELVLERYAAWRRFDNVMLAAATDVFVRVFSNYNPIMRLARGLGMAVVNRIGPARRFFMHEAGGAIGDLPRLLRGQGL